ncbi:MAG: protein TolQ [Gammaproteobacteria bacterium]|nr:MAG: protein TolQ [Gammaproteobacteria bacterium]RKZ39700.1 MAG: protein TolQ [Gammaproteobacteria bacterium]RKZ74817.1 MAG: protein TolQ [Gammaproteobacteria bacterium]
MTELSFVQLVLEASLLVQMVMVFLLLISIYSWALIFRKSRYLKKIRRATNNFEDRFWKGKDLNELYNRVSRADEEPTGIANIFSAGYMEFVRLRKQPNISTESLLEGSQRAMRVALNREIDQLDTHLATLATVGSVSPYIGLFGTVWGIMNSFHALSGVEQVTLAMVAPGISEALVATAMGLFAAIPAVMAHNHYVDEVDHLSTRYDTFLDEFMGILQRQA